MYIFSLVVTGKMTYQKTPGFKPYMNYKQEDWGNFVKREEVKIFKVPGSTLVRKMLGRNRRHPTVLSKSEK